MGEVGDYINDFQHERIIAWFGVVDIPRKWRNSIFPWRRRKAHHAVCERIKDLEYELGLRGADLEPGGLPPAPIKPMRPTYR